MNRLRKEIITAIILLVSMFMNLNGYANDNKIPVDNDDMKYYNGLLCINGNKIGTNDTILYNNNNDILFPMRRVFEELGAIVTWNDEEKHTIIEYNGEKYICKVAPVNEYFPEIKAITFQNIKNLGKRELSSYIQLNSMGGSGSFCIINDYTYLYQDTAERLFRALGCKVEVDTNSKAVYISSNS